jgi:hypothetical protein
MCSLGYPAFQSSLKISYFWMVEMVELLFYFSRNKHLLPCNTSGAATPQSSSLDLFRFTWNSSVKIQQHNSFFELWLFTFFSSISQGFNQFQRKCS